MTPESPRTSPPPEKALVRGIEAMSREKRGLSIVCATRYWTGEFMWITGSISRQADCILFAAASESPQIVVAEFALDAGMDAFGKGIRNCSSRNASR